MDSYIRLLVIFQEKNFKNVVFGKKKLPPTMIRKLFDFYAEYEYNFLKRKYIVYIFLRFSNLKGCETDANDTANRQKPIPTLIQNIFSELAGAGAGLGRLKSQFDADANILGQFRKKCHRLYNPVKLWNIQTQLFPFFYFLLLNVKQREIWSFLSRNFVHEMMKWKFWSYKTSRHIRAIKTGRRQSLEGRRIIDFFFPPLFVGFFFIFFERNLLNIKDLF